MPDLLARGPSPARYRAATIHLTGAGAHTHLPRRGRRRGGVGYVVLNLCQWIPRCATPSLTAFSLGLDELSDFGQVFSLDSWEAEVIIVRKSEPDDLVVAAVGL